MTASAGAIRAGRAFVELGSKDTGLSKGLDLAVAKLQAFGAAVRLAGAGLAGIGSAITAPLLAAAKTFANVGSEIADASARTGVGAEALQELKFAAEQTGASLSDLETGIKKMQKVIVEAGQGSKGAQEELARLGLSFESLAGMAPEKQFEAIAEAISMIQDPAERAAAAMAIFGKSGTTLMGMLAGGRAGLRAFAEEARALGIILEEADIKAADDLGDAFDKLKTQMLAVTLQMGAALAPMLMKFIDAAKLGAAVVIDFVKEHRALVATVFTVGGALLAAGTAFVGLGTVISLIGTAFVAIKAAVLGAGAALAFLVTPMGAVLAIAAGLVAGLVALTTWFVTSTETGRTMFAALSGFISSTFAGIKAALDSKQYELAAKILWASLAVAWETGVAPLIAAMNTIADAWDGVIAKMQTGWDQFWALNKHGLERVKTYLGWQTEEEGRKNSLDILNGTKKTIDEREADRQRRSDQRRADAEKRLKEAMAERDALIGKATAPAANGNRISNTGATSIQNATNAVNTRFKTQGTFSARAASLALGATDPGTEIKDLLKESLKTQQAGTKAAQETAKNTKAGAAGGKVSIQ